LHSGDVPGGGHGVAEEHGDGHGADSAGDFGDRACDVAGGVEVYVTDETITARVGGVGDTIRAYVDDDSAGFEPLPFHVCWLADGGDHDVGLAHDFGHVAGATVADGDGGVRFHEHEGDGQADDVAASDDD